jgi:hypothetical protein
VPSSGASALPSSAGAGVCYPLKPAGRFPLLLVSRALGQHDEGLIDAVAELEDELDWDGHCVSAYLLEGMDEFKLAQAALGLPGCTPIYRRPPRVAA